MIRKSFVCAAVAGGFAILAVSTLTAVAVPADPAFGQPPTNWQVMMIRRAKKLRATHIRLRNRLYRGYVAVDERCRQVRRRYAYNQIARKIAYYRSIGRPDRVTHLRRQARYIGRRTAQCKKIHARQIAKLNREIYIREQNLARRGRRAEGRRRRTTPATGGRYVGILGRRIESGPGISYFVACHGDRSKPRFPGLARKSVTYLRRLRCRNVVVEVWRNRRIIRRYRVPG